jgi:hypothetical protein
MPRTEQVKRPTPEERLAELEAKVEKIVAVLQKQGIWG